MADNTSSTALDLIVGALRNINALEAGETPNAQDTNDALQVLNDMLESWSLEKLLIFSSTENILYFTPGQYQYTIGNPVAGQFIGTLVASSNTISGVTVPSGLVLGGTLTDVQNAIQPGTVIASIGTNTIGMSKPALFTVASAEPITYTTPGNFAIPLPVRITNAFTRITIGSTAVGTTGSGSDAVLTDGGQQVLTDDGQPVYTSGSTVGGTMVQGLDYQIRIIPRDKYTALGLKGINGPWPTDLYYDRTFPLGNIYVYPNPSMAGQLHLWTDTVLSDFADPNNPINLPQGYARAIKTNLAMELAAEYGKAVSPTLMQRARESKQMLKSLNSLEAVEAFFDQHILKSRRADAGWILHGGFYT